MPATCWTCWPRSRTSRRWRSVAIARTRRAATAPSCANCWWSAAPKWFDAGWVRSRPSAVWRLNPEQLLRFAEVLHRLVVLARLVGDFAGGTQLRHFFGHVLGQGRLGRQLGVNGLHLVRAVVGPGSAGQGKAGNQGKQLAHGALLVRRRA